MGVGSAGLLSVNWSAPGRDREPTGYLCPIAATVSYLNLKAAAGQVPWPMAFRSSGGFLSRVIRLDVATQGTVIPSTYSQEPLSDDKVVLLVNSVWSRVGEIDGDMAHKVGRFIRRMRRSMTDVSRRDACRGVFQLLSQACVYDEGCIWLLEEINRRMSKIRSRLGSIGIGLFQVLEQELGSLYAFWLLMWEWQKRVRRGIPGRGMYEITEVVSRAELDQLGMEKGSLLCLAGFEVFRVVSPGTSRPTVMSGEVEVYFAVGGECLRRLLRRGDRGYSVSHGEGCLMPFWPLRVWARLDAGVRVVVYLEEGGGGILSRGGVRARGVSVSKARKAEEAEVLYRESLLSGADGSLESFARGVRGLQRAAELGHVRALADLGDAYRMGCCVPVDEGAAFRLYKRAADGGNVVAMDNVGWCLWAGRGVRTDRKSGLQLFIKSAEHGFSGAIYNARRIHEGGDGVEIGTKVALAWHGVGKQRFGGMPGRWRGSRALMLGVIRGQRPFRSRGQRHVETSTLWFLWEGCMTRVRAPCATPRARLLGAGGQRGAAICRRGWHRGVGQAMAICV
jgi:hypothetical protein